MEIGGDGKRRKKEERGRLQSNVGEVPEER